MTKALIGPNAIIQVADAINREFGPDRLAQVMQAAGLADLVAEPPSQMVDERDVARLHRAVAASMPVDTGRHIMWQAGENTARYLLANRIPRPAQIVLKMLPSMLAARALLKAIEKHAWTFAGSSSFTYAARAPVGISLKGSPLFATPDCRALAEAYFQATFETLFRVLVNPSTRARSMQTAGMRKDASADTCAFVLDWSGHMPGQTPIPAA